MSPNMAADMPADESAEASARIILYKASGRNMKNFNLQNKEVVWVRAKLQIVFLLKISLVLLQQNESLNDQTFVLFSHFSLSFV